MARPLRWKHLTIGLIGLGAVIAIAIAVLLFARIGAIRGPKVAIYVTAASATGVLKGTEVTVSGKKAGRIKDIVFAPPDADTATRLVLEVELMADALPMLRRDSYADIHPSGTIIGAPVVELSAGTTRAPPLQAGDTVRANPQVAAETVADRVAMLGQEFGGMAREWRSMMTNVRTAQGTFGAMRVEGPRDIGRFRTQTGRLIRRMEAARGTVGALQGGELQARAASVVATLDTLSALLDSDRGNMGRFRRDSTLLAELEKARTEAAAVAVALSEARGTAGRMEHDQALERELNGISAQLDLLIEDFKRNPLRYLAF
jgi:phospholipid/cholesterol/gamma-HCH transport system substrate-binding protein